jgi:hypothetical protein
MATTTTPPPLTTPPPVQVTTHVADALARLASQFA